MNKITNILLLVILAILVVGLFVGLGKDEPKTEIEFGYVDDLGYSGMNQTTTDIGIVQGGELSSTTAYKIFSENSARIYAKIELDTYETAELRLYFGTTTYSLGATATEANSPDFWATGMSMSSTTIEEYIIGPDNLWKGEVWGLSADGTITVRTMDK